MSWQLGSFAILTIALAGGFAWYERTRPDARIVALVATLAAFAALGRIAFAALPNVKPTTDIVLISGFALGPAPGFSVGAIAGLTSNFFFGQGPWTPWQMAAWGATGLLGAGLGRLTARRLGRWPLALVCALAGFAFTAIQDAGDWVNYSDHSAGQLGVYVGKGLGFDAVHAVSCLLFALAFGPALARSLARFARRLQVTWEPRDGAARLGRGVPLACVVAVAIVAGGGGGGKARAATPRQTPLAYLLAAQNPDGGFGLAPGQPSAPIYSGWAALGLAAAGVNPQHAVRGAHSLIGYLDRHLPAARDPGSLERAILAFAAAGAGAGGDLVAELQRQVERDGSVAGQVNLTAFAVLALRGAGRPPSARTIRWLGEQQDRDGGFNYATAGGQSDVDDTGAALEALAGRLPAVRARAVQFLATHQDRDGGFPSQPGEGSNAQSTAWALQGLIAAGASRSRVEDALAYLRSLIAADGHVRYSRELDQTPVWVTAQALLALARKPLPLAPADGRAPAPRGTAPPSPDPALLIGAVALVAVALLAGGTRLRRTR